MVRHLMDTLRQHALEGKAAEGGFKSVTWNACVNAVKPHYKGSGGLTAKCCRNKFAQYKRTWRIWKAHCRSVSGWGRNHEGVLVNEFEIISVITLIGESSEIPYHPIMTTSSISSANQ